jgi:hypothetical protein
VGGEAWAAHLHAQVAPSVIVRTVTWATWLMEARASPRKPYVVMRERSSKVRSLDVVKRRQRIGRSACCHARSTARSALTSARRHVELAASRRWPWTHPDATAVVLDLEQLEAAVLDRHADRARAGVERVLDQLLEGIGRPLDDLVSISKGVSSRERARLCVA